MKDNIDNICLECGQRKPTERSRKQNSFRWVVLEWIWQHEDQEIFPSCDYFHDWLKIKSGYVTPICDKNGELLSLKPKSTSFGKMPQDEFNVYFNAIQDTIWRLIVPEKDAAYEKELCELLRMMMP